MAPSINPDELGEVLERFRASIPRFERAGRYVERELARILASAGVPAAVTYRVKDVSSYRGKVIDKGYADPWAQVTDKVGARVIVQKVRDVDAVHKAIAACGTLPIVGMTDKRKGKSYKSFEYSGLHLDVEVPSEAGETELITCEVQVRTIAQDAWSVVSHKFVYKPEIKLPKRSRHAIVRLVGLVELFDEEVERVITKYEKVAKTRRRALISNAAESNYRRFNDNSWSTDLSTEILDVVGRAVPDDQVEGYPDVLTDWVEQNAEGLEQLYSTYGAGSEWDSDYTYALFTQPESIVILERLEHTPELLDHEWNAAGLPEAWLRPMAAHAQRTDRE